MKFLIGCGRPAVARIPMRALGYARWALSPGKRRQVQLGYTRLAQVAQAAGFSGRLTTQSPQALTHQFFQNRVLLGVAPNLAAGAPAGFAAAMFQNCGMDALEQALAEGRGMVYVGTHFGALGITPALLARWGYRVIILRDKQFDQYKDTRHGRHFFLGATPLFLDHDDPASSTRTLMACARAIKEGAIIAYTCDASHGDHIHTGSLFGKPVLMRTALIELAVRCKAPVSGAFTYVKDGSPTTLVLPPERLRSTEEIETWCTNFCKTWERMLLDYPESLAWSGVDRTLIQ